MKLALIGAAIGVITAYLYGAFTVWDLRPAEWVKDWRESIATLAFVLAVSGALIGWMRHVLRHRI